MGAQRDSLDSYFQKESARHTMPSVAIIGTRGYPSHYGGFETAVRKLAPYLVDNGWSVTVYGRGDTNVREDPERDPRINVVNTRGLESKSFSTLSYGFTASLDAMKRRPDVALVMNVANGFFLPVLRSRGIPTLVNVDGIEWDRDKWGRLAKSAFRTGARLTAKWATELVVDAQEIGKRWQNEFHRNGLFIPYGGEAIPNLPVPPGIGHREYALVVARFVPENTISEFFQAAEMIAERHPVVIVGSSGYGGTYDDVARQLATRFPNIHVYGHVKDDALLHGLWQHAGAYFHGHSVGGTNPALVQAMAAGAPVVARDTRYNREVLSDAGLYVQPDPAKIAMTIDMLLRDRAEQNRMSTAGISRAAIAYSWDTVCAAYEDALRRLIRRSDGDRRAVVAPTDELTSAGQSNSQGAA